MLLRLAFLEFRFNFSFSYIYFHTLAVSQTILQKIINLENASRAATNLETTCTCTVLIQSRVAAT